MGAWSAAGRTTSGFGGSRSGAAGALAYGGAVLVMLVAVAVALALNPASGGRDDLTVLVAATGLTAVLWGLGPGLLAVALGVASGLLAPVEPGGGVTLGSDLTVVHWLIFVGLTGGVTLGGAALRRCIHRSARHQADLTEVARRDADRAALMRGASHELRSPLGTLAAAAEALAVAGRRGDVRDLAEVVGRSTTQLRRVVDNMLTMERLEAGDVACEPAWCPVTDLVHDAVRMAGLEPGEIEVRVPRELREVCVDVFIVERILVNLLQNARVHGAPPVEVSVTARDGQIEVTVRDSGGGVPPERAQELFEAFNRGDASPGIGLGLELARFLAHAHGGSLELAGTQRGAAFVLRLPRVTATEAQ